MRSIRREPGSTQAPGFIPVLVATGQQHGFHQRDLAGIADKPVHKGTSMTESWIPPQNLQLGTPLDYVLEIAVRFAKERVFVFRLRTLTPAGNNSGVLPQKDNLARPDHDRRLAGYFRDDAGGWFGLLVIRATHAGTKNPAIRIATSAHFTTALRSHPPISYLPPCCAICTSFL